jgi:hypothetical protein
LPKINIMVQERISGNGNFQDLDAILKSANAMENASTLIEQPFVDREMAELEAEAAELETDLQNPSSNRVDEAQAFMQRTGAAKLNVSGLQAGITIQESRNEFSGGARGSERMWEEREKREEKERKEQAKIADMADDLANASKPMTPEQWDEAPSTEYPGMTNAEALAAIRRINANLPFFSQLAVQRGLIRPEDELAFQTYMRNEQWLMEQERAGNTNTAEYRARKQQQVEAQQNHPEFEPAAREVVRLANDRGLENSADAPLVGAQGNAVGSTSRDSEIDAFSVGEQIPASPTSVSVAKSLDQSDGPKANQTSITGTFNASADGTAATSLGATPIAPAQPLRVASTNFDQSAGMI